MDEQGSQGSQDSQGFNAPQQPDSHGLDPNEPRPSNQYRADAAPRSGKRDRKYENNKRLRKKNAHGVPQYIVTTVSARYDDEKHRWMYTLNDWQNQRIAGETPEKELG